MSFWRKLWCTLFHTYDKCEYCYFETLLQIKQANTTKAVVAPFKWIEDYGPFWSPESTAFWLEPRTREDLIEWFKRYCPDFHGTCTVNDITVSINRKRDYIRIETRRTADINALSQMYYAQMQMPNRRQQALLAQQQASNMYNNQNPFGLVNNIGRIGL